ncbi:MAG TPA: helix-turn-helix transcriptional regulator [Mycobacteriales bacterium]|nr:helix-turn-helix transcriptional regulator [Mycobacteriales bacterium]
MFEWWDEDPAPAVSGPLPAEGELGKALRGARDRVVWSQKELAAITGVTQSVISRMERGQRTNWATFCRLLEAMGLEPVVTTRRRKSDLEVEAERLAPLTAEERLAERGFVLEWAIKELPATGWALDGDAALLAHGVPVTPAQLDIATAEETQVVYIKAGDALVPLLPLDRIELGPEGTSERTEREAAIDAYLAHMQSVGGQSVGG